MKRILITLALCLAIGSTVFAQQNATDAPATKEDVQKYMDAMHMHDMMLQMVQAMSGPMHKMMHDQFVKMNSEGTYKLPADFEARMNKITDDMLQELPWDEMIRATMPVYQKHLTKGDLEALTIFYSSPTGQKILREMPAVTAEGMEVMMPMLRKHMDVVMERVQQQVVEMMKEYESAPAKPRPPVRN